MARTSRKALVATLCVAALGVGSGCGGDDGDETGAAPKGTFVGTVKGTNAYIALVSNGKELAGYVCNGTAKAIDVYFWLDVSKIKDGKARLVTRRGDSVGEATLEGGRATGTVNVQDKPHAFSARTATGDAGLYRGIDGEVGKSGTVEAGWILLGDGTQRGGVGVAGHTLNVNVDVAPNFNVNDRKVKLPNLASVQVNQVTQPQASRTGGKPR